MRAMRRGRVAPLRWMPASSRWCDGKAPERLQAGRLTSDGDTAAVPPGRRWRRLRVGGRALAAAAAVLLVLATGCGDDGSDSDGDSGGTEPDPVETQAQAILDCTTEAGLPGQLTRTSEGVRAVDLSTSDQTIVLHVHESTEDAEAYDGDTLDFDVVGNVVVLGGAISPENRTIIDTCIEQS